MYITGESYGGLYVPYLAWHVYLNNLKGEIEESGIARYNLKGFVVANGVTDVFSDWTVSMVETMYRFNVIPAEWYHGIQDNGCASNAYAFPSEEPEICGKYWQKINRVFDKLNPYDLLRKNYEVEPMNCTNNTNCSNATNGAEYGKAILGGQEVTYPRGIYQDQYTPWLKHWNTDRPDFEKRGMKKYKLAGTTAMSDYFNN